MIHKTEGAQIDHLVRNMHRTWRLSTRRRCKGKQKTKTKHTNQR